MPLFVLTGSSYPILCYEISYSTDRLHVDHLSDVDMYASGQQNKKQMISPSTHISEYTKEKKFTREKGFAVHGRICYIGGIWHAALPQCSWSHDGLRRHGPKGIRVVNWCKFVNGMMRSQRAPLQLQWVLIDSSSDNALALTALLWRRGWVHCNKPCHAHNQVH